MLGYGTNRAINAHGISVSRRVRQAQRRRTSPTHEPSSRLCRLRCVGAALDAPYSLPTKRAASSTPERNTPMEFQVQTRADLAAAAQPIHWIWEGFLSPGGRMPSGKL